MTYLGAEVLKATLEAAVFDLVAGVQDALEHSPGVPRSLAVVEATELQLLLRGPEMAYQELAREIVPSWEEANMLC